MTRPIFITPSTDKVEQQEVEQIVQVISFWLSHHVAPAWDRSPTTVQFTSNPDAPYQFSEQSTVIEVTDAMAQDLSIKLSQAVASAFLDPSGNTHYLDSEGNQWELDPCGPVRAVSYPVSDGSKSATLSDFVLPSFYDSTAAGGTLFDYCSALSKPFSAAKGGRKAILK